MNQSLDYFFNYNHTVRFLLLHKINVFHNTMELPFLKKISLFFSILDLVELDDPRVFNYYYLLRFFFGSKAFFSNFRTRFSLGRTFYSFNIVCFFSRRLAYFPVFFLVNDMLYCTNRSNYSFYLEGVSYNLSFYDMNLFLEKKNNLGLFNLRNFLGARLFFSAKNFHFYGLLLSVLKII